MKKINTITLALILILSLPLQASDDVFVRAKKLLTPCLNMVDNQTMMLYQGMLFDIESRAGEAQKLGADMTSFYREGVVFLDQCLTLVQPRVRTIDEVELILELKSFRNQIAKRVRMPLIK